MLQVTLLGISYLSEAQEPLLLESINQSNSYIKDTFETESTTTYAYDENLRLINRTKKGPELCDDCTDYIQSQLESEVENWSFNKMGLEVYYSAIVKFWRKNEPQNPWKLQTNSINSRKTTYVEDTLIGQRVDITEYPRTDWQVSYKSTQTDDFQYNSKRQKIRHTAIYETINGNYTSGSFSKDYFTYENDLVKTETYLTRSYSNGDTIDYTNYIKTNSYDGSGKIQSFIEDYDYNGSKYKAKKLFIYNSSGQTIREENYYWNVVINDWALTVVSANEYYPTGIIKKNIQTSPSSDNNYDVTTIEYNEMGKQILLKQEVYDKQMVFIKEVQHYIIEYLNDESYKFTSFSDGGILMYSNYTESNASGKPLIIRFETKEYLPDSSFQQSSLTQTLYEYDNSGALTRTRETRVSYDADSLIMVSCCGWQYEAESLYSNRCDGTPLMKTRRQYNYVPGTEGDVEPLPLLTRDFYTYTPALCDIPENEDLSISIFPNPTKRTLNISSELLVLNNTSLKLVTTDGRLIRDIATPITTTITLDMTGIPPGLYIVRLENGNTHTEGKIVLTQ